MIFFSFPFIKPIYYKDDKGVRLLPEFIYGYIPVEKDGILGDLIHNSNYKDIHNLNNTNLLYEESAFYKAKREGIDLNINDISYDKKYEVIEEDLLTTEEGKITHNSLKLSSVIFSYLMR